MPYKDPEKQRLAVRVGVAKHRKDMNAKLTELTGVLTAIKELQKEKNNESKKAVRPSVKDRKANPA